MGETSWALTRYTAPTFRYVCPSLSASRSLLRQLSADASVVKVSAGLGADGDPADSGRLQQAFKGSFFLTIRQGEGTPAHDAYMARRVKLPLTTGNGSSCNLESGDDGAYLWAGTTTSTGSSLYCAGYNPKLKESSYEFDAFGYDAVFAIAHALHELIEVQNVTEIVGSELLESLITRVRFEGVTGMVDFYDASDDPGLINHGDRWGGASFDVLNYKSHAEGLALVGKWMPCGAAPCTWLERWNSISGMNLTFSTVDNSKPLQSVPPVVKVVRLGVLLPAVLKSYRRVYASTRRSVYQAVEVINNKSDGIADMLLPRTVLSFAYGDSKCDRHSSLRAAIKLSRESFGGQGVSAMIGAACSGASISAAEITGASRIPLISPSSTSPSLSDGILYDYFLRVAPSDAFVVTAIVDVLQHLWNYTGTALVHSMDAYGVDSAAAFSNAAQAAKLEVQTVRAFPRDAVDFSVQHEELQRSGVRVSEASGM